MADKFESQRLLLRASFFKVLVQVSEKGRGTLEARGIVFVRHGYPSNQMVNTDGFLSAKFRIFEVDVVNDLGDRVQRSICNPETM
jgi:hypothetical protein